ncbi:MAG: hypothetical protein AMXMBFR64_51950 [Myxococcales bacterium]
MMRTLVLLLLVATTAHAETLDTSRLVGVIAGVLSWEDTSLTTYSVERRKDQELHALLVSRGASPERLALILDAEATTARVRGEIARTAALAEPGDTFVFYYAGHGMRQEDGRVVFATWDVRSRDALATGLVAQELAELLRDFRGRRVLLWADCCHSGALMHVARALAQRGIPAAAITSADLASASTDNWTFTQTVIDALRGEAMGDRDGDGTVTLGELGAEVRDAMAGRERQRAGEALCGVPPGLALARARGGRPSGAGAYVEVQTDRGWEAARVVASGQKPRVQLYRYTDKVDLEVEPAAMRPRSWKRYPVGAAVDVTWEGKVYEARVKGTDGDFHWIGYPGWSDTWDEWVLSDRIVGPHQEGRRLDAVEVEWGGRWWPALVMRKEGESSCIHYVGYDASWDECVGPDRVRAAR